MGSQPSPPSVGTVNAEGTALANTQQGFNTGAQAGSQYNQTDPYGSLSYSQTGVGPNGVPTYSASTQYSPQQQQLLNQLTGTQTEAGSEAANTLGFGNYGTISPAQQIGNMTSGTTGQILGQETNYLDPFFQTQQSQLDTQLQNEGLQQGNPAYDNAVRSLDTNQGLTVSNFLASAEPQAFSQATSLYNEPASVAENLAGFGSPTSPTNQFTSALPALQPANVSQDTSVDASVANSAYQGQQAQYNAMMSGIFGLGSAGLGALAGSGLGTGLGGLFNGLNNASTGAVVGMPNYATAANPYNPITGNYGIGG